MSTLRVATANIRDAMSRRDAAAALDRVLDEEPDLVALQEWYLSRRRLLAAQAPDLAWHAPWFGGCPVGVRRDRFDVRRTRTHLLSRPGWASREEGRRVLEPARLATSAIVRERPTGRLVGFVSYHLVSGVEAGGSYRDDRPRLVARHRREAVALEALVRDLARRTDVVVAAGDSNRHRFRLDGLVSAWDDSQERGTLGSRLVDDVFAPSPVTAVSTVATGSDHLAVIATRDLA